MIPHVDMRHTAYYKIIDQYVEPCQHMKEYCTLYSFIDQHKFS